MELGVQPPARPVAEAPLTQKPSRVDVMNAEARRVLHELMLASENRRCADCDGANPDWASVNHGAFLCLSCSGIHRSLGVHVSFVRSATMDSWTTEQLNSMRAGGNGRMNAFLERYGCDSRTPARAKYESDAARAWRERVKCVAGGGEWKRPKWLKSSGGDGGKSGGGKKASASGSSMELFQFEERQAEGEASARSSSAKGSISKTGYDLSTGQGSLVSKRYEHEDDGWVPPPPPLPKGAKMGDFLSGLTPHQWVDFLKRSLQEDRTYHLKNMTEEERAQVVAAMSGLPIPPRSGKKHVPIVTTSVATNSSASDLKTLNPFEDSSSGADVGADDFFSENAEKKEKKAKKEKKEKKEKKDKSNDNETDLERRMREAGEAAKALARERMLANPDTSSSVYAVPKKQAPSYSPQQSYFHGASTLGRSGGSKYEGFGNTSSRQPEPQDWQSKMKVGVESAKGWLSGTLKGLAAKLDNTTLAHSGGASSSSAHNGGYQQSYQQAQRPPEVSAYRPPEPQPYSRMPPRPQSDSKPERFYSSSDSSDSD